MSYRWWMAGFSVLALAGSVQADILVITFDPLMMVVQGQGSVSAGTFTHPSLSKALQVPKSTSIWMQKSIPVSSLYGQMIGKAGTNADELFKAAMWGARKGLVKEVGRALEAALKADPNHAGAKRLLDLKKEIEDPLPDNPEEEAAIKSAVSRGGFKLAKSAHFLLLHDLPDKAEAGEKKAPPARRLELLEQSYLSFTYLFLGSGAPVQPPKRRMRVVVVDTPQDYREMAVEVGAGLSGKGFFHPAKDLLVLQGRPTTKLFAAIDPMYKKAKKDFDEAKKARSNAQSAAQRWLITIEGVSQLDRENAEVSQISRESVPLFIADLGLFPRSARVPDWIQTGLSMYLESPEDMAFSGGAAVSPTRIAEFKAFAPDRQRSSIDFVVGDQILDYTRLQSIPEAGRVQAWALIHFLMEEHPQELMKFFKSLGDVAPDSPVSSQMLLALFRDAFGISDSTRELDREWHGYMDILRTDIELLSVESSK